MNDPLLTQTICRAGHYNPTDRAGPNDLAKAGVDHCSQQWNIVLCPYKYQEE